MDRSGRQHPRHRHQLEDAGSHGRILALEPQRFLGLTTQDRQAAVVPRAARVAERAGSEQDAAVVQVGQVAQVRVL